MDRSIKPEKDKFNKMLTKISAIPFYTDRLPIKHIRNEKEIMSLPITIKEELRKIPALDMITAQKSLLFEYHESSGTTGTPIATWFTKSDFDAYVEQLDETPFKINESDIVLIRFPYSLSVPAHTFTELVRRKGGCIVPVSKATKIAPYPRVVNLLKKLDVTILCCMPIEAFIIKAVAQSMGFDLNKELKKLRALFVAGEMLSASRKHRLEQEWGVPVYEFYGTTETGNLATSCECGNLHCSVDHFHFEVLNNFNNKPVPFGEKGLLHITTFSKDNFPLLRYDVGDIVELGIDCKCGNPSPILHHHGRWENRIEHKGKVITQREIEEQIFTLPEKLVGNFYRVINKENSIEIHLESGRYQDNSIVSEIKDSITLDIPFELKLFPPEHIQNISELLEYESYDKPLYFVKQESREKCSEDKYIDEI
jgi:phenylacetate-CoA ligase